MCVCVCVVSSGSFRDETTGLLRLAFGPCRDPRNTAFALPRQLSTRTTFLAGRDSCLASRPFAYVSVFEHVDCVEDLISGTAHDPVHPHAGTCDLASPLLYV